MARKHGVVAMKFMALKAEVTICSTDVTWTELSENSSNSESV
jgi:hypothetical protein